MMNRIFHTKETDRGDLFWKKFKKPHAVCKTKAYGAPACRGGSAVRLKDRHFTLR